VSPLATGPTHVHRGGQACPPSAVLPDDTIDGHEFAEMSRREVGDSDEGRVVFETEVDAVDCWLEISEDTFGPTELVVGSGKQRLGKHLVVVIQLEHVERERPFLGVRGREVVEGRL
jgi:hypothetical protein